MVLGYLFLITKFGFRLFSYFPYSLEYISSMLIDKTKHKYDRHVFLIVTALLKIREGRDIGLFLTLVPKVLKSRFHIVGLTTWGTLI